MIKQFLLDNYSDYLKKQTLESEDLENITVGLENEGLIEFVYVYRSSLSDYWYQVENLNHPSWYTVIVDYDAESYLTINEDINILIDWIEKYINICKASNLWKNR